MNTKIAISSNKKGTITEHAGKCSFFYVYTIDSEGKYTKDTLELEKGQRLHDSFENTATENPIFDMDMLLTQSLGQGAIENLATKNVKAYIIQETDPDTAINKLIEGTLKAYVSDNQHHHEHNNNNCCSSDSNDHDHNHKEHSCGCGNGGHHHN